jgi:hypothetical protein
LDPTLSVFNDPKHIDVDAPDFTIRRKGQELFPVGWIEAKDKPVLPSRLRFFAVQALFCGTL